MAMFHRPYPSGSARPTKSWPSTPARRCNVQVETPNAQATPGEAAALLVCTTASEGRIIAGPPGVTVADEFGRVVTLLQDRTVVVGAPNTDVDGLQSTGAVYIVAVGAAPRSVAHPATRPRVAGE